MLFISNIGQEKSGGVRENQDFFAEFVYFPHAFNSFVQNVRNYVFVRICFLVYLMFSSS